jgi:hypothetical protein
VFGINLLISMLEGEGLGGMDGLLHFFGESIKIHSWLPES